MGLIDWSIWLVYFTVMLLFLWIYRNGKENAYYKYLLPAFLIKVLGGLAFAMIYMFYYGFGDTFLYFESSKILADLMVDNPTDYFRLLASGEGANIPVDLVEVSSQISYSRTYEEWFMVKLLSPVAFISFKSYIVVTLFMSTISFIGAWKLFRVFLDIIPERPKLAFIAAFLVPSVIFWGSGIMKDTLTLFAINYSIYCLYFTIFKKRFELKLFVILAICFWLIISLKAYIALAFLPGLMIGIYVYFTKNLVSKLLTYVLGPIIFLGLLLGSYYSLSFISESSSKYSSDNLEYQVKGFHSWHTDVGGSSYSLGDVEYTPSGVASKIPAALNVTFFRPYLWEARNPVVAIGAIESLLFLVFFVLAVWKHGFKFMKRLREEPLLFGLLIYCIVFGFAVGFTSYNFGALARYKIPIMSLFTFILIYLYYYKNVQQTDRIELSD